MSNSLLIILLFFFLACVMTFKYHSIGTKSASMYIALFLFGCLLLIVQKLYHQEKRTHQSSSQESIYLVEITTDIKRKKWFSARGRILGTYDISQAFWTKNDFPIQVIIQPNDEDVTPYRGQPLLTSGSLQSTNSNPYPNAFDFNTFLKRRGIHKTLFIRSHEWVEIQTHADQSTFLNVISIWRTQGLNIIDNNFSKRTSGIIKALVFGYRGEIDEDTISAFSQTGAMHVLSVSGLHVGIVVYILYSIIGNIVLNPKLRITFSLLIIPFSLLIFTIFSGNAPPVRRASIMTAVALSGQLFPGRRSTLNFLFFTAFIFLIADPQTIYDVSFQLSFGAVLSIVLFHSAISKAIHKHFSYAKPISDLVSVSISAQILTFPLIIYYFKAFPLLFIISGIIAVVFAYLILCGTFLFFTVLLIGPFISNHVAFLLELVVDLFLKSILALSRIPFSSITEIWLNRMEVLFIYLMLLTFIAFLRKYNWKIGLLFGLLICVFSIARIAKVAKAKNQIDTHKYKNQPLFADVLIGRKCYELIAIPISTSERKYIAYNNRLAHRISRIQSVIIDVP